MPLEQGHGRVSLVGAGPGAVDLLTVRALRCIEGAQALLYDALVSDEIIRCAPAACLKIQTGKRAGRASMKQETINRLMLRLARRGLKVVRLKGGDPSVFGRVGEEAAFLRNHSVAFEIVPGITAVCAAAAQFDLPLTHRAEARRLVIATATTADGRLTEEGWASASDRQATLALYMGRSKLGEASQRLIAAGRPAGTPVLAVQNAGRSDARTVSGTLADLPGRLAAAKLDGPVVVIVGEVAARSSAWGQARAMNLSKEARL
ncbi:uroporphyrinogen-III C-methyltransferase [Caulobacter sp. 73W]|uniref:uroporphyrinogen-III C-methyltransferase n=1 Tax=Caulobacter sp. 73W TaxID=3161137 RepID=A0AB39KWV7_9CAUL